MHLLESEPELPGATPEIPAVRKEGARDWFVLIDGTRVSAVSTAIAERFTGPAASPSHGLLAMHDAALPQ
ncbi:hypothetical protein XH88_15350 [Bradyrhizobium sp. CCBAU 51627]|nr:hypothetical protein [Bradyrhizobium sp. CCBAU 51627]MDA9433141.1 hypothetical protein [Bradyrhizobium sp. CCBAU 51627]